MSTILAMYKSSSSPKLYSIIRGRDGVTYCDCMGWKMKKICKHLVDWHSCGAQGAYQIVQDVPNEPITEQPVTVTDSLDDVVSRAISIMRG